jgi:tetratricopeptide (TPR) repeat protein
MQTLPKYAKFTPILLFITAILFIVGDHVQFDSPTHIREKDDPTHDHGQSGEEIDHSSPEAQRRMGIFHYNEGNKFLNKGNWEEAVTHYRMALHHNKNFEEAYVNLSTAYLSEKKFNESRKILSTLEEINPSNPSLHYNLACYHALTGQDGPALNALQRAVELGFKSLESIETDPDLENLRSNPKFEQWWKTLNDTSKH